MQGRILNGRYRLDEVIGEGGMAVVYRAHDLLLGRPVAVKILRDQYASHASFLARFEREAQSAARLSHPNIVSVYDVGQDGPSRYIVMEYINGPSLKDLIRRQGPFTVGGSAFVLRQIAAALDYAHRHGVVHRDIKPQNILVDEHGVAKVVDFGIAKGPSDSNLTEAGSGMGTVHYVSPEQARGERATALSDIYSAGVVLYEMLTKRLPFEADTPVGVGMQHVSADPPSPRQFNPAIQPEVEAIVLRALAKRPEDRFPTATALADALEHWNASPTGDEATRVMSAAALPPEASAGPQRPVAVATGSGGGRAVAAAPAREAGRRNDIGCVTWLIGSAILIGIVGLVILGFRLADGGLSVADSSPTAPPVSPTSNPVIVVSPTPATPSPTATPTPSATPTRTPEPSPTPSPTPVLATVPQLIGSTVEQARVAVQPGGFQLAIEEVFSDSFGAGLIADQDPAAGARVEEGSVITVRVSQGPGTVTLPRVQGRPVDEVVAQLEALGLTVQTVEEPSSTVPRGNVIRVEPANQVASGGTVTVYVSSGDQVIVPNVYGVPYQQAINMLENAGLVVESATPWSCEEIRASAPNFDCASFVAGGVVSATAEWESSVPRGTAVIIAYYDPSAG